MLKKFLLIFSTLVGLFLLVALSIPFFIDVDEYRPDVIKAAEEKLNGKLELGKLSLQLWGQIKVSVDGFKLSDPKGKTVVAAEDVELHVPFFSLFGAAPRIHLRLIKPEVNVVKSQTGKWNVLQVVKEDSTTDDVAKGGSASETEVGESSSSPKELPGFFLRAKFGMEMREAHIRYHDQQSGVDTEVKDFNILLKNLSMNEPIHLKMWADLNTKVGKDFILKGPFKVEAKAEPQFGPGGFDKSDVSFSTQLDDLHLEWKSKFKKPAGMVAGTSGELSFSERAIDLQKIVLRLHNAEVSLSGKVDALNQTPKKLDLILKSNEIPVDPWAQLIPTLADFKLGGKTKMDVRIGGTSEDLKLNGGASLVGVTYRPSFARETLKIDMNLKFASDRIDPLTVEIATPSSDLRVVGKLFSFDKPHFDVQLSSKRLNLDKLMVESSSAPVKVATNGKSGGKGKAASHRLDNDALFEPLRKSTLALKTTGRFRVDLQKVTKNQLPLTQFKAQASLKNLSIDLKQFQFYLFGGKVSSKAAVHLRPGIPKYSFRFNIADLNLKKAVESQAKLFKNTLLGKATFGIQGTGASFNAERAKSNLNAKGKLNVKQAEFASIDIGRIAVNGINKAIEGIKGKVPGLGGKQVGKLKEFHSKYEVVRGNFTIRRGQFRAPNFHAIAVKQQGIDVKGKTQIGLLDKRLVADWELIDRYNLTNARSVSANIQGTNIPSILADGNSPVRFPVRVRGTVTDPKVDYGVVPEALLKVALKNAGRAAEKRLKQEAKKAIEKEAQKLLKGIGGGLFR